MREPDASLSPNTAVLSRDLKMAFEVAKENTQKLNVFQKQRKVIWQQLRGTMSAKGTSMKLIGG